MRAAAKLGLAAAALAACACGDGGGAARAGDPPGGEREHPDWSSPEDERGAPEGRAAIDGRGVERADGVWLFPAASSALAGLPPGTARIVAAQVEVARLGDDVAFAERGPESLRAKTTLERILLHGDGLPAGMRAALERYLLGLYVHHGSAPAGACGARTNAAGLLRPDFIPGELAAAAELAARKGATFDVPRSPETLGADRLQELEALMTAIRPVIFGRFVPRRGEGAVDAGTGVADAPPPEAPRVGAGRTGPVRALEASVRGLASARGLAPSREANDGRILSPGKGTLSMAGFAGPEEGGGFYALVGVPDAGGQKPLDAALERAAALDRIVRAVGGGKSVTEAAAPRAKVRAVEVLYASGALGPLFVDGSLWRMIDGPSVRAGAKGAGELWILTNAAASFDASFGAELVRAMSRDPAVAELRLGWRARTRLATNALREAAGRGTDGTETRPAEWISSHLGRFAPLLAAMRADLAALYLALDPAALDARIVEGEEGARALYEDYVGWAFESYGFGAPPPDLAPAAEARRAILRNLAAAGAVEVRGGDGEPWTYAVADPAAFRAAVASLLAEVRRIRFVGDAKAAAALAESFLAGEARWRREIEARYRGLDRPGCVGFSFAPEAGKGLVAARIAALPGGAP